MRPTCMYVGRMSRVVKIRNVSDSMHRKLKARAARAGMSPSDFLLAELRGLAERPTVTELRERVRHRSRVAAGVSAADAVRRERDAR
jgi:plasmid stability protein